MSIDHIDNEEFEKLGSEILGLTFLGSSTFLVSKTCSGDQIVVQEYQGRVFRISHYKA